MDHLSLIHNVALNDSLRRSETISSGQPYVRTILTASQQVMFYWSLIYSGSLLSYCLLLDCVIS